MNLGTKVGTMVKLFCSFLSCKKKGILNSFLLRIKKKAKPFSLRNNLSTSFKEEVFMSYYFFLRVYFKKL